MSKTKSLEVQKHPHFLSLILTNEAQRNCLSPQLMQDVIQVVRAEVKSSCRFVLLLAKGEHFCAGADLEWMKKQNQAGLIDNYRDSNILRDFFHELYNLPVPLISYAQGGSYGGGVGLLSVCDYVYADAKASFCLSEVKLGLVPAVISPYVITKVGYSWFQAYSSTAKLISAGDAQRAGLIHEICTETFVNLSIEEKIKAMANPMLKLSPQALIANKRLVRSYQHDFIHNDHHTHLARSIITQLRGSQEGVEGMSSLLEKRKPKWTVEL